MALDGWTCTEDEGGAAASEGGGGPGGPEGMSVKCQICSLPLAHLGRGEIPCTRKPETPNSPVTCGEFIQPNSKPNNMNTKPETLNNPIATIFRQGRGLRNINVVSLSAKPEIPNPKLGTLNILNPKL